MTDLCEECGTPTDMTMVGRVGLKVPLPIDVQISDDGSMVCGLTTAYQYWCPAHAHLAPKCARPR